MERMKVVLALLAVLCLVPALPSRARPVSGPSVNRSVVGPGGQPMTGITVDVHTTAGQHAVGPSHGGGYHLCAGYWCLSTPSHVVYLPLILRTG